jgi:hypothetical protein
MAIIILKRREYNMQAAMQICNATSHLDEQGVNKSYLVLQKNHKFTDSYVHCKKMADEISSTKIAKMLALLRFPPQFTFFLQTLSVFFYSQSRTNVSSYWGR